MDNGQLTMNNYFCFYFLGKLTKADDILNL